MPKKLIGTHDFIGFFSIEKNQKSTTRTIEKITIERNGENVTVHFLWAMGSCIKWSASSLGHFLEIGAGTKELAIIDELFAKQKSEKAQVKRLLHKGCFFR
ncbi:hypothetical protein JG559_07055 [Enterococcus faecalis]|uniref:Pseudouridine synthase I TruA alpha/beta domain-containing protein n=1 Tax=Enterococcus faecalis TaxID=1351 RepID=A0A974NZD2_ENTFL|nr:hypothetical protein JG559_07055 [Enterococcus faecalis]